MNKCCANCIYGRLICNREKREEYVGCIRFRGFEKKVLLKELKDSKYVSPISNIIFTGWIFFHLPFGVCREHYDTADAGIIANGYLISPKEAYCNRFISKEETYVKEMFC